MGIAQLIRARRAAVGGTYTLTLLENVCTLAYPALTGRAVDDLVERHFTGLVWLVAVWLVHLALRRPYTFVCASILILIFGIVAILRMPIDIFPAINVPVVSMLWSYGGLSPREMEQRIVSLSERVYSSYVNDIEHIESQSLNGLSIIKVYFQPDADVNAGMAQLTAASQGVTRTMPPGISPPFMVRFNATDVPIMQIGVSSPQGRRPS